MSGRTSSPSPEPERPSRVILLERCRGVQVGRGNRQFSVYRVNVPDPAFRSPRNLAETLLSPDTPWSRSSRDVFSHSAQPDLGRVAAGRLGSASSRVMTDPRGDTLVIVRESRGVQIGHRNVQRNEFRIRVSDVPVQASRLGKTAAREKLISRLCADPCDRAAARRLAKDLGRSARLYVKADMTARVKKMVDHPQINRWRGRFRGLTGRQVGGPGNRARVKVNMRVSKFDTRRLARALRRSAARLARRPTPDHGRQREVRQRTLRDPRFPGPLREMRAPERDRYRLARTRSARGASRLNRVDRSRGMRRI